MQRGTIEEESELPMAYVRLDQMPVFDLPQWPQFNVAPWPGFVVPDQAPPVQFVPQEPSISPAGLLLGSLAALGVVGLIWAATSGRDRPERRCTGCGSTRHDRRNCNHTGERRHFSKSIPRSKRCECCGKYGYDTHRHHPRGRADDSDWLDVCNGCHLHCCHKGDFNNFATKPRFCLFTGGDSYWRTSR
jgi:hypothetical protein